MADAADGAQVWTAHKQGAALAPLIRAALTRKLWPSLPRILTAAKADGVDLPTICTQIVAAIRAHGRDDLADFVANRVAVILPQMQAGTTPGDFLTAPFTPFQ